MTQCSLVYKEDGFLTQFLGAVFAMATGGKPLTCSLECPSPDCTLGTDGTRYQTPELEAALAMQLLMMHDERNHKQSVQVVESSQSRKAEKVSRPTIKMGSSEDDFIFFKCLFESYRDHVS